MIDVERTAEAVEAAEAPEAGAAAQVPSGGARELPRARYRERSRIRIAVLITVNLVGLMAFLWPFALPALTGGNENHHADGPLILLVLLVCLGTLLFVELAAAVATRVVMLAGGEVIADGDPGVVLGDSTVFAPQMTRAFGPGWLTPEQVAEALT